MQRISGLFILIWMLVLGALVCAIDRVVRQGGGLDHFTVMDVLPWVLMALATAAGLLAFASFRRDCAELADAIRQQRRDKTVNIKPLGAHLGSLARAIEESNEAAAKSLSEAQIHTQVLGAQLKVAEAERQNAEAIIDTLSDAVLVTDLLGELVVANEAAAKTFALDMTSAPRSPVDQVVRDPRLTALIQEVSQNDSTVPGIARVTEQNLQTPGGERTFKITLSTIAADKNTKAGVVAVLHDMTPEKQIAELKNEFVSSVSHELRTPLASIKAYVEMLIDGEAHDEKLKNEFYEVIQNEANRLGRLIDNMLNVSRIESGLVQVEQQPQSMRGVIREAIDAIMPQARTKNVTLVDHLTRESYEAMFDRDLIYQVVVNLLSNAVKYTPDGGTVRIENVLDHARHTVVTRVVDNGAGIPATDLPFIFEKFYRVEANTHLGQGTGLGLSLVKHVVEKAHKGTLSVCSEVGKGSCFQFELKLRRCEEDVDASSTISAGEVGVAL